MPAQGLSPIHRTRPETPTQTDPRMGAFLRQLWPFIAPHRGRLVAGALSGLIYALGGTLLLLAVKLVLEAIFPTEGARDLVQ